MREKEKKKNEKKAEDRSERRVLTSIALLSSQFLLKLKKPMKSNVTLSNYIQRSIQCVFMAH